MDYLGNGTVGMSDGTNDGRDHLTTRGSQPLIGVPVQEGETWVVHYFTSEADANEFLSRETRVQTALSAIGKWTDIDFDEMLDALDEIRHRNPPTPLIDSEP
jgi:hypothetical protein